MLKNVVSHVCLVALISAAQISDAVARPATVSEAVSWLESESHRLIRASRRTMKDGTSAFPPQVFLLDCLHNSYSTGGQCLSFV